MSLPKYEVLFALRGDGIRKHIVRAANEPDAEDRIHRAYPDRHVTILQTTAPSAHSEEHA
ncbi:hypothetical protein GCM10016455_05730 [Aliiroseovarius zhejiangensis]|uniref:Uncharacterized protein n=1 Tax=Aliiroseovarius zhejiangensis TaxID=1632025 RepID=A0ABQ3IMX1_9RHOB|nr:hypothetical protein [Aliiroseovarius zhejiangensis]GHE88453.1 hypothetical protein GCM10016455_05730 [Aliiroseovarius zhejiangensis]